MGQGQIDISLYHESVEDYLEWLEEVAPPELVAYAKKQIEFIEMTKAEGKNVHSWSSSDAESAVYGDLRGLMGSYNSQPTHPQTHGLYWYYRHKKAKAAERAAETRERTRNRYGPGYTRQGHERDSQRQKVYDAEHGIQNWPTQQTWKTVPEMQAYVDKLLASAWWKRRWPSVRTIKVKDGRGHRSACSEGGSIEMPRWSRKEAVILHEIAHEVVEATIGYRNAAYHGREFCVVFLELVGHKMGKTARMHLKHCFQAKKVRHTKARKPMSEEQRQAAAERLAAARQR